MSRDIPSSNMADSGADIKAANDLPDTGQRSEETEVTSATEEGGAGVSSQSNPFHGVKPARFIPGNNPFAARPTFRTDVVSTTTVTGTSSPPKFILRPSTLSAQTANLNKHEGNTETSSSASCLLKPAKLPDPTKAVSRDNKEVTEKENKLEGSLFSNKDKEPPDSSDDNLFTVAIKEHEKDKEKKLPDSSSPDDEVLASTASSGENILGQNLTEKVTGVHTSPKGIVSSSDFVFGENLAERVEIKANADDEKSIDNGVDSPDSTEQSEQNTEGKTLAESAREYQELRSRKPELQEVEVFTGEENESNVLQTNGKLFVFDGETENWIERGRGTVRLNDMKCISSQTFQSRLLMRTQGSLRLILNTKVWPGMTVERASQKSVRVTGTDGDCVKVFLLMTNPKDTENILRALDWRIQQLRVQEEKYKESNSVQVSEKRKADTESPTEELSLKKAKKSDDEGINSFRREESDSSVVDPETEVSSESHTSSLNLRTDSD